MKKILIFVVAAFVALTGSAFAQDYADNAGGGNSASLDQSIDISIPNRVALHLTQTQTSLNLNDIEAYVTSGAQRGCYLVRKDRIADFSDFSELHAATDFDVSVSNYPAVVFDGDNTVAVADDGEYLKGGLLCQNYLVAQKFSNYKKGWLLAADVDIDKNSGIKFGILDYVDNDPANVQDGDTAGPGEWGVKWVCGTILGFPVCVPVPNYEAGEILTHYVDSTRHGLELDNAALADARHGRTNGWLDDHIFQYFYFDGSETAGNHDIDITYTLTGNP